MCGIIGAVAQRDVVEILLAGLRLLEYRGYDSAGLTIVNPKGKITRIRRLGKVQKLVEAVKQEQIITGGIGIAHTRWATHGVPSEMNAHPHRSEFINIVHNGIIENYESLRVQLIQKGYKFSSSTDTEVLAHLINWEQKKNDETLSKVLIRVIPKLRGTYSMVLIDSRMPSMLVAVCSGSPLIIGCGLGENFIASDQIALLPVTRRFIYLEEGDIAEITRRGINFIDHYGNRTIRTAVESHIHDDYNDKGVYRHYMQKEIYEQPIAIKNTLIDRFCNGKIDFSKELGANIEVLINKIQHIQIIACGTSYHSGLVSRYWFESLANISCNVEIASEYRYRKATVRKNSFLIMLSQSGETADTLAALRLSKKQGYLSSLVICNVANSSLVRESDFVLMTKAGIEVGVASTKAFTTQLTLLLMLVVKIGRLHGMKSETEYQIVNALQKLPNRIEQILEHNQIIEKLAEDFSDKQNVLFLGRGEQYPIAMEAALKLKEVSYIHAEGYAAGELKHGPLALIDANMPVIVIAPNNELLKKLKTNIEEVRSRGGLLYVFTAYDSEFEVRGDMKIISLPYVEKFITPILYIIPLQLLAYHIALIKGTDIDQPRNLAKSVTVE